MNPNLGGAKILIPISNFIDKEKVAKALDAISISKSPFIVLLHIIEVPSLTSPINSHPFKEDVTVGKRKLEKIADWLRKQGYKVEVKVLVARDIAEGIVEESNIGKYQIILMMKRKIRSGLAKLLHKSVSEVVIRSTNSMVLIILVENVKRLSI